MKKCALIGYFLFTLFGLLAVEQNEIEVIEHKVKDNENLWMIGRTYGISWRTLAKWNELENPSLIFAGQKLKIPLPKGHKKPNLYWIEYGDTLGHISLKTKVPEMHLIAANNITYKNWIRYGFPLILVDKETIAQWKKEYEPYVLQLGDPSFQVRKAAQKKLLSAKGKALPAMIKHKKHQDPEVSQRIYEVLETTYPSALGRVHPVIKMYRENW